MVIFLWSVSLFAAQVLLAPTLSNLFASRSLLIILSPIYLSFALVALVKKWQSRFEHFSLNTISLFGFLFHLGSLAFVKLALEAMHVTSMAESPLIVGEVISLWIFPIMLVVSLPYFFYYWALLKLVESKEYSSPSITFFYELLGAATGIVLGAFILDRFSWVPTLQLIVLTGWLSVCFSAEFRKLNFRNILAHGVFIFSMANSSWFEPVSSLNWTARFARTSSQQVVTELERSWTTFAKIQVLQLDNAEKNNTKKYVVIGDGAGTATISDTVNPVPRSVELSLPLVAPNNDILVLFAGAGSELESFAKLGLGKSSLIGIEINQTLINLSKKYLDLSIYPNVSLVQSDARRYLETGDSKFDFILFSWSGATSAFYNGAAIHTAKYSLTQEALLKAVERLKDDGSILILGVSKVNMIASVTKAGLFNNPKDHIVLAENTISPSFKGGWDRHALYLKKSKWKPSELDNLAVNLKKIGYQIVVSPSSTTPDYKILENVLSPEMIGLGLKQSVEKWGFHFAPISDNKPFPFDVKITNRTFFNMAFSFLIVAALLVVGLLLRRTGNIEKHEPIKTHSAIAFMCGVVGASAQIYLIYKILLFTGLPSLAMNIGVGLSLLSSAVIFWVGSKFRPNHNQLLVYALIDIVILMFLGLVFEFWPNVLFKVNYFWLLLFLGVFAFAATVFASLLFSFLINEKSNRLQIIGLDAVGGFLAVLIVPILIEYWGINFSIGVSIVFLLLIALLLSLTLKSSNEK